MSTTTEKKKKKTTLDLREKANRLKAQIERKLVESHGEITDEIDEMMNQLNDLFPEVSEKIESLRWAKTKVEAQKEGAKAIVDFYKGEAKKEKKTVSARDSNIEHIKNLVMMNLSTLESRDIRLSDGKKVYIRQFFSANIDDEAAAWSDLRNTDMAEKKAVLTDDGADQVKGAILSTLENIQTNDGEPMDFPPEVHSKLMDALDILGGAELSYSFDKRAINSEVKRLHKERKEALEPLLAELQEKQSTLDELMESHKPNGEGGENEEQIEALKAEINDLHKQADLIEDDYGISGVSYDINESVFGL